MAGSDADLVVCLNPMSSLHRGWLFSPTGPIASAFRDDNRRVIDREAAMLLRAGTRVFVVAEDLAVMGQQHAPQTAQPVAATAFRTMSEALEGTKLGELLRALARGASLRVRRPESHASTWPSALFPPERRSA
jgi:hypothetical protein